MTPAGKQRLQTKRLLRHILLMLMAALIQTAHADETTGNDNENSHVSYWLSPGFYSYHFQRNRGFKENNYGPGLQVELSKSQSFVVGEYRNSDNNHSNYLGMIWSPYQIGATQLGIWAGVLDGYKGMQNGGWFAAAFPMLSYEYQSVGFNFTIFPTYKDALHGAIVMQLRFKVFEQ